MKYITEMLSAVRKDEMTPEEGAAWAGGAGFFGDLREYDPTSPEEFDVWELVMAYWGPSHPRAPLPAYQDIAEQDPDEDGIEFEGG